MAKFFSVGLAAAALAACAAPPQRAAPDPDPAGRPAPSIHSEFLIALSGYDGLPAWAAGDHKAALSAIAKSCDQMRVTVPTAASARAAENARAWAAACAVVVAGDRPGVDAAAVLQYAFQPLRLYYPADGAGLVTAYFEPELEVRRAYAPPFTEPILAKPHDLYVRRVPGPGGEVQVQTLQRLPWGRVRPYPTRAEITADPDARVLAWGRPSDVIYLQIQGSGRLIYGDGTQMRAAFAATNGRPYRSIARVLMERGHLPQGSGSNDAVRAWLDAAHPVTARGIINANPRYVFFQLEPLTNPAEGPRGAAGVPLTAAASIAVDRRWHDLGAVYWIAPNGAEAPAAQYGVAQDVGGAIKGPLRADLYFGSGAAAGRAADRVKHDADWWALVPRPRDAAQTAQGTQAQWLAAAR